MATAESKTITVFEAINHDRKEIYVGMTTEPMFETIRRLKSAPPTSIREWDFDSIKDYRSIEFGLSEKDAKVFIDQYVKTAAPKGWRYHR